jgi:hypothetical protein
MMVVSGIGDDRIVEVEVDGGEVGMVSPALSVVLGWMR